MILLVGLGNPGAKYENTRHNVGFMVIDEIARRQRVLLNKRKYDSLTGSTHISGSDIILMKPQTYMNLSGNAVKSAVHSLKVDLDHMLILHDDIDLPLGRIKIKLGGGSAGHNGIRSIADVLSSSEFPRMRIGVGRPPEFTDPADYVLEDFCPQEIPILRDIVGGSADAAYAFIQMGLEKAMNRYNRKEFLSKESPEDD